MKKEKATLDKTHPHLAAQWHPTKNGDLKPSDVVYGSRKKVWWFLSHVDTETGRCFNFEWEATISNRTIAESGCPYLCGKLVCKGFNDLATKRPDLAKEWHPTKNGDLSPTDVTCCSKIKVWWMLPYDDPRTGKHFDFEWEATIANRVNRNSGCPYLTGNAVYQGFNDLATRNPELAAQWHPTKNGKLNPTNITSGSNRQVWWYLLFYDEFTNKSFEFEWIDSVYHRVGGRGCPYISNKKLFTGFNDFATRFPELAREWHPTKNGDLRPSDVLPGSHQKVWWFLSYIDPQTCQCFEFEWQASLNSRTTHGDGCPFLSGKKVYSGFNDLASKRPDLVKEWHPTKNGALIPSAISANSNKKVWWAINYKDPVSQKEHFLEWKASVDSRVRVGAGCPYLAGKAILVGFNDLATTHPELANEWHPTKNGNLKPTDVVPGSRKKVWWKTIDSGKEYEWEMRVLYRAIDGAGCPELSGSHLEKAVRNTLKKYEIQSNLEWIVDKFKSDKGGNYRYDFYLPKYSIVVECDGEQHFMPVEQFGGKKEFDERIKADNKKNDYAFKIGKPILRIPYVYLKKLNELEKLILNFIQTKTIPQEIIDFYSQFEFSNYVQCVKQYYGSIEEAEAS